MSDCQNKPSFPHADLRALNIPALRYLKPPVDDVADLYEKYPTGNEKGTFAYVHDANLFYAYHPRGCNRGEWRPIGIVSEGGYLEISFGSDGDEKKK